MKYSSLEDIQRDLNCKNEIRGNQLFISPPGHTQNSDYELVITAEGDKFLHKYFGRKYNEKDAVKNAGIDIGKLIGNGSGYTNGKAHTNGKSIKPNSTSANDIIIRKNTPEGRMFLHTNQSKLLSEGYEIKTANEDICRTYNVKANKKLNWKQLSKYPELVKFGTKEDDVILLWYKDNNLINPNNKKTILIAEGLTNNLALLSEGLDNNYAIGFRRTLKELPKFKDDFDSYIFIRDSNEDKQHLENLINKYYKDKKGSFYTIGAAKYSSTDLEAEVNFNDFDEYLYHNSTDHFITLLDHAEEINKESGNLWSTFVNESKDFWNGEPPETILNFDGLGIMTRKETLLISGPPKQGKSSTMLHLALLRTLNGYQKKYNVDLNLDHLLFTDEAGGPDDYFLYIDPENSSHKAEINTRKNLINAIDMLIDETERERVKQYVKEKIIILPTTLPKHRSNLKNFGFDTLNYINKALADAGKLGNVISGFAIDNFLKLNPDNSSDIAERLSNKIESIKEDYNLTCYISIHHNKDGKNPTGHFGTALMRYAASHLIIKDDKIHLKTNGHGPNGSIRGFKYSNKFDCFDFRGEMREDTIIVSMKRALNRKNGLNISEIIEELQKDMRKDTDTNFINLSYGTLRGEIKSILDQDIFRTESGPKNSTKIYLK